MISLLSATTLEESPYEDALPVLNLIHPNIHLISGMWELCCSF